MVRCDNPVLMISTQPMEYVMPDSISREAQTRIDAGESPDSMCHVVTFPGYPEGSYLSTALPAGSDLSGYTAQYRTLTQWAKG